MEKIIFNWMLDLRKKDIDIKERADIIQAYLDKTGISKRALAKELGVPHTTLHHWLAPAAIPEKEYKVMKDTGKTQADINKELRMDKPITNCRRNRNCTINKDIENFMSKIRDYTIAFDIKYIDEHSQEKIKELIKTLKTINDKINRTKHLYNSSII